MSENWRQAYIAITDFIANHSEIKIEPSVIRIGEAVSDEFYHLFQDVRESFIKEKKETLFNEAEVLSKQYLQVEEEVIKLLGLERISLFPRVDKFFHNPKDELIKELRNPLFDLLKGRIDIEKYEEEASNILVSYFNSLYQQGYEVWMILSLIKLLEADKSYRVYVDQFDDDELYRHGGVIEVPVYKPDELREISFIHNLTVGILVADQIVHSAKNGHYFSFRPNIVEPQGEATDKSRQREWLTLPVETIINMGSNIILVYMDKELDALSLIADSRIIARPDLIIECVGLNFFFNEYSLINIKKINEDFKPKMGTYVISSEPLIEEKPEDKEADIPSSEDIAKKESEDKGADIHFLSVGFDQNKLEQITSLFTTKENNNS